MIFGILFAVIEMAVFKRSLASYHRYKLMLTRAEAVIFWYSLTFSYGISVSFRTVVHNQPKLRPGFDKAEKKIT